MLQDQSPAPGFRKHAKVLLLFSGPNTTRGNIADCLDRLGIDSVEVDILNTELADQNILDDAVWLRYRRKLAAGEYDAVFASPPCRTFSEARLVRPGPAILRDLAYPYGYPRSQARQRGLSQGDFQKL